MFIFLSNIYKLDYIKGCMKKGEAKLYVSGVENSKNAKVNLTLVVFVFVILFVVFVLILLPSFYAQTPCCKKCTLQVKGLDSKVSSQVSSNAASNAAESSAKTIEICNNCFCDSLSKMTGKKYLPVDVAPDDAVIPKNEFGIPFEVLGPKTTTTLSSLSWLNFFGLFAQTRVSDVILGNEAHENLNFPNRGNTGYLWYTISFEFSPEDFEYIKVNGNPVNVVKGYIGITVNPLTTATLDIVSKPKKTGNLGINVKYEYGYWSYDEKTKQWNKGPKIKEGFVSTRVNSKENSGNQKPLVPVVIPKPNKPEPVVTPEPVAQPEKSKLSETPKPIPLPEPPKPKPVQACQEVDANGKPIGNPKKPVFIDVLSNNMYAFGGEGAKPADRGPQTTHVTFSLDDDALKKILLANKLSFEEFSKQILAIPKKLSIITVLGSQDPKKLSWRDWGILKAHPNILKSDLIGKFDENSDKFVNNRCFSEADKNAMSNLLNRLVKPEYPAGSLITITNGNTGNNFCNPGIETRIKGGQAYKDEIVSPQETALLNKYFECALMIEDSSRDGLRVNGNPNGAVESSMRRLYDLFYNADGTLKKLK